MADISKCTGKGCIKKRLCYRYTAPAAEVWQSWFVTPPLTSTTQCEYFWSNKGRNYKTKKVLTVILDSSIALSDDKIIKVKVVNDSGNKKDVIKNTQVE